MHCRNPQMTPFLQARSDVATTHKTAPVPAARATTRTTRGPNVKRAMFNDSGQLTHAEHVEEGSRRNSPVDRNVPGAKVT